jgi:predicted metalloprotease with PDZ domain
LAFSGFSVFIAPNAVKPEQILITYSLPSEWKFFSTWQETEMGFTPAQEGTDTYINWHNSIFAAGIFYEYRENIFDNVATVLIPKTYPKQKADEFAQGQISVYQYEANMFGTFLDDDYLTIVLNRNDRRTQVRDSTGEWSTSLCIDSSPQNHSFYTTTHGSFHRWNGFSLGFEPSPQWWGEGLATYYGVKITTKLGIPNGAFEYTELMSIYESLLRENSDSPVSNSNSSRIIYRKGALVASLIDYEIKLRTNEQMTLDNFLQSLFGKYSAFYNSGIAKPCDNYCLLKELNIFTNSDFTEFFSKYVFGKEQLPIDWLKADDDNDSLLNYQEILYETNLSSVDTDSDGFQDNIEVRLGTSPLSAESFPTPTSTPVPTSTKTPEPTATKIISTIIPESRTSQQESPSSPNNNFIEIILVVVPILAFVIYWIFKRQNKSSR